jgi:hypothetical protein
VFDANHNGYITVADMTNAALEAFAASSVGQAIVAKLDEWDALEPSEVPTSPELSIELDGGVKAPTS